MLLFGRCVGGVVVVVRVPYLHRNNFVFHNVPLTNVCKLSSLGRRILLFVGEGGRVGVRRVPQIFQQWAGIRIVLRFWKKNYGIRPGPLFLLFRSQNMSHDVPCICPSSPLNNLYSINQFSQVEVMGSLGCGGGRSLIPSGLGYPSKDL